MNRENGWTEVTGLPRWAISAGGSFPQGLQFWMNLSIGVTIGRSRTGVRGCRHPMCNELWASTGSVQAPTRALLVQGDCRAWLVQAFAGATAFTWLQSLKGESCCHSYTPFLLPSNLAWGRGWGFEQWRLSLPGPWSHMKTVALARAYAEQLRNSDCSLMRQTSSRSPNWPASSGSSLHLWSTGKGRLQWHHHTPSPGFTHGDSFCSEQKHLS